MPVKKTDKIWHNGKLIAWDDAKIHVLSHVVHYGSSVFEGIRCYDTKQGPAIFRVREHMRRLVNSGRISGDTDTGVNLASGGSVTNAASASKGRTVPAAATNRLARR